MVIEARAMWLVFILEPSLAIFPYFIGGQRILALSSLTQRRTQFPKPGDGGFCRHRYHQCASAAVGRHQEVGIERGWGSGGIVEAQ